VAVMWSSRKRMTRVWVLQKWREEQRCAEWSLAHGLKANFRLVGGCGDTRNMNHQLVAWLLVGIGVNAKFNIEWNFWPFCSTSPKLRLPFIRECERRWSGESS
jgi:hypothetical protein